MIFPKRVSLAAAVVLACLPVSLLYNPVSNSGKMESLPIPLHLYLLLDPLSLFFLFVIVLISVPSTVYSIGYMKDEYPLKKRVAGWVLLAAFVLSMAWVVTAGNAFVFLVAWELMSLISYFLVTFDHQQEKSVQAGTIYIVMTHIGTAFITIAFLILFTYAGSFDFLALREASRTIPGGVRDILFLLFLAGFGTKAGIVPLHIWLPVAHPQAPSPISSIMSGVMIKTAIYGMLRFILFILGIETAWWGNLVLILALISCLVGVTYALMEHDLKRLLAFHSVENIGIILLGVGASMVFLTMHLPRLAILALSAGLYHLVNHAIFKGLLFLCAGSVYKATGTRNMEKLGGLIKRMPWTAVSFLMGAMAISAIVPLNGFVSEWLTLQAFFLGALNSSGGYKIFMALCAALLALTGGLAASCFVKAFGITFLAMPRTKKAEEAKEAPFTMKAAMVFLSLMTIAFGLAATVVLRFLTRVSGAATGVEVEGIRFSLNPFVVAPVSGNGVSLSSPLIALVLLSVVGLAAAGVYLGRHRKKARTCETWDCGYYHLDSRTEYSATAFSKPFRIAFSFFLLPYNKTEKVMDSFYHVRSFKYEVFTTPVFRRYIYEPILRWVFGTAHWMRRLQPGSIHIYLAYIFITILALIAWMSWS
jgi:hydrogenase-4 component B